MKKGAGIVVAMKDDLPEVAQITNVYIINGNTAVLRARLYSCLFVSHYHGYTLHAPSSVCEKLFYMSKFIVSPSSHSKATCHWAGLHHSPSLCTL